MTKQEETVDASQGTQAAPTQEAVNPEQAPTQEAAPQESPYKALANEEQPQTVSKEDYDKLATQLKQAEYNIVKLKEGDKDPAPQAKDQNVVPNAEEIAKNAAQLVAQMQNENQIESLLNSETDTYKREAIKAHLQYVQAPTAQERFALASTLVESKLPKVVKEQAPSPSPTSAGTYEQRNEGYADNEGLKARLGIEN